ncbi:MAG: gluconate 2-dehydrogenase subunit 3 family protein, partial [Lacunisphaera sp.]
MNSPLSPRPDRRTAIKWMLAAAASTTLLGRVGHAATSPADSPTESPAHPTSAAASAAPVTAAGYGTDPDLVKTYKPGDVWPLTMTDAQRATAAALCAVIIPADASSPSAADLHVHDFIDEWVSAPYPNQTRDRPVIFDGLAWIEAEAQRRFSKNFTALSETEKTALCDDICFTEKAAPQFKQGAKFFARFRDLTASGFYTTPQGMKDIGYTGNTPLATFDGPP